MILGIDHIALRVKNLDERVAFLTGAMGMQVKRFGTQFSTGARLALLSDTAGFKIELIESAIDEATLLLHVAYRVDDVDAVYTKLLANGCKSVRAPHDLSAAKARTALAQDSAGLEIQIIQYASDSPDL